MSTRRRRSASAPPFSLTEGTASGQAGAGHVRMILATPRPLVEQLVAGIARAAGR
ncbi:MAG: hypothetical protein ACJLS2_02150 [Microcella pacifica]